MKKMALITALAVTLMGTAAYAAEGGAPAEGQTAAPSATDNSGMAKGKMGSKSKKHTSKKTMKKMKSPSGT